MYFTQTKLRVHYLHYIKYDNPNKCNEAAHSCVYSVEYRGQKVMTLPFTFTHHYTGTVEEEYTQKIHSHLISQANEPPRTALIHRTTKQSLKMKMAFKIFTKDSCLLRGLL